VGLPVNDYSVRFQNPPELLHDGDQVQVWHLGQGMYTDLIVDATGIQGRPSRISLLISMESAVNESLSC
jgi:hypothetical protein